MSLDVTYMKYQFTCSLFLLKLCRWFLLEENISPLLNHCIGHWCPPVVRVFPTFLLQCNVNLYFCLSSCAIQNRIPYIASNIWNNLIMFYMPKYKYLKLIFFSFHLSNPLKEITIYILSKSNFFCISTPQTNSMLSSFYPPSSHVLSYFQK